MKHSVVSIESMAELVQEYKFLPLLKNDIPGFSVEEHTPREFWFAPDRDGPWEWKGPVIQLTGCAYGKFFGGKAGFITKEWYPDFANYRRDGYDFDARFEDGLASMGDKLTYDILEQYDSLLSSQWKKEGGFGKHGRKGFDSILTRLQMQGYVVTADFEYRYDSSGRRYGWGVGRYATPERYFGENFTDKVYLRSPEESKEKLLEYLSGLLPELSEKRLKRLAG